MIDGGERGWVGAEPSSSFQSGQKIQFSDPMHVKECKVLLLCIYLLFHIVSRRGSYWLLAAVWCSAHRIRTRVESWTDTISLSLLFNGTQKPSIHPLDCGLYKRFQLKMLRVSLFVTLPLSPTQTLYASLIWFIQLITNESNRQILSCTSSKFTVVSCTFLERGMSWDAVINSPSVAVEGLVA